jgi:hypothetical protein
MPNTPNQTFRWLPFYSSGTVASCQHRGHLGPRLSPTASESPQGRDWGQNPGLGRTVDLARVDGLLNRLWALSINLAANAERGAQNLQDDTLEALREGLEPHRPRNVDDLVEADRLVVLDVLLLLPVAGGLLEGADDERRSGGDNRDGGLTVLDGELDGHAETLLHVGRTAVLSLENGLPRSLRRDRAVGEELIPYPVTSGLGDIFTDLLGRETKRTDLGGKGRRGADLTTGRAQVAVNRSSVVVFQPSRPGSMYAHDLHLIGVELGSCKTSMIRGRRSIDREVEPTTYAL